MPDGDSLGSWEPLEPAAVARLFDGFSEPWWVGGGWALDLFLGRHTRVHEDIDVEIPHASQAALAALLAGWDLRLAADGVLTPWHPETEIPAHVNSLWCRRAGGPWQLQVMLAMTEGEQWLYRRDHRIRRALTEVYSLSDDGIPYVAPEIQLLFKSKSPRPKDERDFEAVAGMLSPAQRDWLEAALGMTAPDHPWLEQLLVFGNT